jgi:hypothetical protein
MHSRNATSWSLRSHSFRYITINNNITPSQGTLTRTRAASKKPRPRAPSHRNHTALIALDLPIDALVVCLPARAPRQSTPPWSPKRCGREKRSGERRRDAGQVKASVEMRNASAGAGNAGQSSSLLSALRDAPPSRGWWACDATTKRKTPLARRSGPRPRACECDRARWSSRFRFGTVWER